MSVFTVNVQQRKIKLRKLTQYFLNHEKYAFFSVIIKQDEIDNGCSLELVSEDLNYSTYLSNEYLDNNTLSSILTMLKTDIDSYLGDE